MKKNTRFAVLSILVFLILAVAFLADKIVPYDPLSASLSDAFQAPGKEHYFGTDALDVYKRQGEWPLRFSRFPLWVLCRRKEDP